MNEEMSSFTPERPPEDRSRQQIQAESWKIQVIGEKHKVSNLLRFSPESPSRWENEHM